jgi:hypothetical protein
MYRAAKKCDGAARAAEVPGLVSPDQVVSPPSWCSKMRVLCDKKPCSPPVILFFYSKRTLRRGAESILFLLCISILLLLLSCWQLVKRQSSGAPLVVKLWIVAEGVAQSVNDSVIPRMFMRNQHNSLIPSLSRSCPSLTHSRTFALAYPRISESFQAKSSSSQLPALMTDARGCLHMQQRNSVDCPADFPF